jgi:hypothetical protein
MRGNQQFVYSTFPFRIAPNPGQSEIGFLGNCPGRGRAFVIVIAATGGRTLMDGGAS